MGRLDTTSRKDPMPEDHDEATTRTGRERLRTELSHGFKRALGLIALGTVLPGAGLTRTRHRFTGWFLVAVALLAGGWLAYLLATKGALSTALGIAGSTRALQIAAATLLVGGVVWVTSIILTAVDTRPESLDKSRTRILAAFTAVMVVIVAGGSYTVADYALVTKDTVTGIFTAKPKANAPKIAKGEDPWADTARVTMMLIGSDAAERREGTRTDSMVVASIDTKTGDTVLISLPRNLERAPIPEDSPMKAVYPERFGEPSCEFPDGVCILAYLWRAAEGYKLNHPDAWPGEDNVGLLMLHDTAEEITGLTIDHTVVIDLQGFSELVDAMGGIDVNVKLTANGSKVPIGGKVVGNQVVGIKGYFEPGLQHLNGYHALWYARSRNGDSDFGRMQRQRCVIRAIVDQVNPARMFARYEDLAHIAEKNIYTDIAAENLSAYVTLVERVQGGSISSVVISPSTGIYSGNPDYDKIREMVAEALAPKPTKTSAPPSPAAPSTDAPTTTPEGAPTSEEPQTGTPTESPTTTAPGTEDEC